MGYIIPVAAQSIIFLSIPCEVFVFTKEGTEEVDHYEFELYGETDKSVIIGRAIELIPGGAYYESNLDLEVKVHATTAPLLADIFIQEYNGYIWERTNKTNE